ncbi:MAG TPA: aldo/keto reductase [Candidatus Limnocylindrales bacterium]|nr:aldo/keto reductase [Candidatus Limnocylindrales bacterium]
MRIGLGTAQFGLDYGISNRSGRVTPDEGRRILALAATAGVRVIDTAAAYGDAEARLGRWLPKDHPFSIVTKLSRPSGEPPPTSTAGGVVDAVHRSLERLRTTRVHGLLAHDPADLLGPDGSELWRAMESVRDAGAVDRIGASVYSAWEIDALLERYPLELVQVPLNVLDQRLVRSGHLAQLKAAGVEVHARSAFLQGLLLMDPAGHLDRHFDPARGAIGAFQSAARATGRSPLQAAVAYALSVPEVDVAVFGVTRADEFAEILSAEATPLPQDWFAPFALEDERILNPSMWPR